MTDALAVRDPIWAIMKYQHRTHQWLAGRLDYTPQYISLVASGDRPATAEFRRKASLALDLPESVLFSNG